MGYSQVVLVVIWLDNKTLFSGRLFYGIICLGSATYYHGISSYPPNPLTLYSTSPVSIHAGYFVTVPVKLLDYNNTIRLADKLYVTDAPRTVCDLIERNGDSENELIYECIDR